MVDGFYAHWNWVSFMSSQKVTLVAFLIACIFSTNSYAQGQSCLEHVLSEAEADTCMRVQIDPVESAVAAQFQRLVDKYKGNKEMIEMLNITAQDWKGYWNIQCMSEGMAAAGGQTGGKLPLLANKAFLSCVHRILLERQVALSKL